MQKTKTRSAARGLLCAAAYIMIYVLIAGAVFLFRVRNDPFWIRYAYRFLSDGRLHPAMLAAVCASHRLVAVMSLAAGAVVLILICFARRFRAKAAGSDVRSLSSGNCPSDVPPAGPFSAGGYRRQFSRLILPFLAASALILFGLSCLLVWRNINSHSDLLNELVRARQLLEDEGEVIHAGGNIQGKNGETVHYTNSLESLQNCISRGKKLVELDFRLTSDGYVVCVHSWNMLTEADGTVPQEAISLEAFTSSRVKGDLTPMTLDTLAKLMESAPDLYITTDVRGDLLPALSRIREKYPALADRFIIQIYQSSQFRSVWSLGFHKIIYTMYRTTKAKRSPLIMQQIADKLLLLAITLEPEVFEADVMHDGLLRIGLPLFIHTIDDPDEQARLKAEGAAGVYTNVIT